MRQGPLGGKSMYFKPRRSQKQVNCNRCGLMRPGEWRTGHRHRATGIYHNSTSHGPCCSFLACPFILKPELKF